MATNALPVHIHRLFVSWVECVKCWWWWWVSSDVLFSHWRRWWTASASSRFSTTRSLRCWTSTCVWMTRTACLWSTSDAFRHQCNILWAPAYSQHHYVRPHTNGPSMLAAGANRASCTKCQYAGCVSPAGRLKWRIKKYESESDKHMTNCEWQKICAGI